jgi:hypothetical protein
MNTCSESDGPSHIPPEDRIGADKLFAEARVGSESGPLRLAVFLISLLCLSDIICKATSLVPKSNNN